MQEMFDFFEKLSGVLTSIEEKAVENSAGAIEADGKEKFAELIKNLQQAKSQVDEALVTEKRVAAEEQARRELFAKAEPEFVPPPMVQPEVEAAPLDTTFGLKVRNQLVSEFLTAGQTPATQPPGSGFDSWIESSVSIAPALTGGVSTDQEFARKVHQRAVTLGAREAIWWACVATMQTSQRIGLTLPRPQLRILGRASSWVANLSFAESDESESITRAASAQSAADAIDLAVELASKRSTTGIQGQFEHPQEAAATAILLACSLVRRQDLPAIQNEILELGNDIAAGRNLWTGAAKSADAANDYKGTWSSWIQDSNNR
jgi:hypothetical protein